MADLRVDLQKLLVQGLVVAKLIDLSLGFPHGGWCGQRFGDGLAMQLVGQPDVGAVTWGVGLMAAAIGLAAAARGGGYGTTAQVGEGGDLLLAYYIRTNLGHKKRTPLLIDS